jgi:Ser/Thr protein kinase RdoA (MazF antagonist)
MSGGEQEASRDDDKAIFGVKQVLSEDFLSSLLVNWDLSPINSMKVFETSDYWCSGNVVFIETQAEKYVLKRMTAQHTLKSEYALLAALYAHGVPVAVPKLTRQGEPCARQGEAYFCLSPYLAGMAISDHYSAGSEERARRFGMAIAQLHIGLQQCENLVMVSEMDLLHAVTAASQVVRALGEDHAAETIQTVLLDLNNGLAAINQELPVQLIHRDAHPANMLFLDEHLSGWLDFELIVRGPRLFDLCYCGTSLLMNGMDDPVKRDQWPILLKALVEGYTTLNPLTMVERSALWHVLLSIEVIFTAYDHNIKDEKGLTQNLAALLLIYENRERLISQIWG